jgi:protein-S-isoprenylcysteine O-methyltransferase Ste14
MIAPIPAVLVLVVARLPGVWLAQHAVGLALLLVGLTLLTVARWQLGNAFSIAPRATTLVTHGLYARIRNPVYVFGLVTIAGLLVYLSAPLWLLIPLTIAQGVRARAEGRALEERFGDAYRNYRARTWF